METPRHESPMKVHVFYQLFSVKTTLGIITVVY